MRAVSASACSPRWARMRARTCRQSICAATSSFGVIASAVSRPLVGLVEPLEGVERRRQLAHGHASGTRRRRAPPAARSFAGRRPRLRMGRPQESRSRHIAMPPAASQSCCPNSCAAASAEPASAARPVEVAAHRLEHRLLSEGDRMLGVLLLVPAQRVVDGRRTVEHGGALPGRKLALPARRAALRACCERVLDRLEHRRPAAADQLSPCGREPRLRERELIAGTREDRTRLLGDREQRGARHLAVGVLTLHLRSRCARA